MSNIICNDLGFVHGEHTYIDYDGNVYCLGCGRRIYIMNEK